MATQCFKFRNVLLASIALVGISLPGDSLFSHRTAMAQTGPMPQMPCRRMIESPFRRINPQQLCPPIPLSPPNPPMQGQSNAPINGSGDSAQPPVPKPPQEITIPPGSTLPAGLGL